MRHLCLRWTGLVVFAVVIALSALLSTLVGPQPHAQNQDKNATDIWVDEGGNVEASTSTLTIREGETKSYSVRLTKQPHSEADQEWWVMIVVDGHRRPDGHYPNEENPIVSWSPSIGRTFDRGNWNRWKDISITAHQDDDDDDHTIIFSSELWDHDAYCPPDLHGGGTPLAMVTVRIIDDDRGLPGLSIDDEEVEEGGTARFRVTLSQERQQEVTVRYRAHQMQNDTAVAGTDFSAVSDTLRFPAGTTQQFIQVETLEDEFDEENETFTVTLSGPSGATVDDGTATGTITDDDGPPALSIADADAVVEGGAALFDVTLTPASGKSVTVAYATMDGTADAPMDYATGSGTLEFAAGDTTKTIRISTINDKLDEPDEEMFTVELSSPSEATLGDATGTGTITDNDALPQLSIGDKSVVEGSTAQFTVTLTPASGRRVTVVYATMDGSAHAGTDYDSESGTLTFEPGELQMPIDVRTLTDTNSEDDEMFTVELSSPDNATLADGTATGTITEVALPALSIQDATVVEGGAAEFTVTLTPASGQTVTVRYGTSDGTAEAGTDYTRADNRLLTFAANTTVQTISVPTADDTLVEDDETFSVALSSPSGAMLADDTAIGMITDNDTGNGGDGGNGGTGGNGGNGGTGGTGGNGGDGGNGGNGGNGGDGGTGDGNNGNGGNGGNGDGNSGGGNGDGNGGSTPPTLSIAAATAVEGGTAKFEVTLNRASDRAVTVQYGVAGDTALAGQDFVAAPGTLTFAPGSTQATIDVRTLDDDIDEPDETFTVTLSDPTGATLLDDTATGTITDNDDTPTLSIEDAAAVEGGTAKFEVTLNRASDRAVTVQYGVAGDTALAGQDFVAAPGTLTFAPGSTQATIDVRTLDDDIDERDETFTVTLSDPTDATIEDDTATGTITDNDDTPTLSVADGTAVEGGAAKFEVTLNRASDRVVTVQYGVAGDTALAGQDFVAAPGTLTFAPGSTQATIDVRTLDDDIDEPDETFTVTLSDPNGATLLDDTATGTITDNDDTPTLSIEDAGVAEGGTAVFNVTLSRASDRAVTVQYGVAGDTALAGQDFVAAPGTLTFAPGSTQATIDVRTLDDDIDERDETFTVTLSGPTGATLLDDTATGTIADNDDTPSLSIADATAVEGGTAEFAVTLNRASNQTVTVLFRTADGTADAGVDYDAASGTLTFAPGSTRETIDVQTLDDDIDERDETFTVTLRGPTGATLADDTAIGTIADNDDTPTLSVADATAVEGGTAKFEVTLNRASDRAVTVLFRTADETANAGADFVAASGTLTFAPGSTRETIDVQTLDDDIDEADETFTVTLRGPTGATLADDTATGTIADNDDTPTLSIADATAVEGGTAAFDVTLSRASARAVTVQYGVAGDTALAGQDFVAAPGTLTFAPGSTQATIDVQTLDDDIDERDETFTVTLSGPTGATLADDTAIGTITDNDDTPTLSVADATAVEGGTAKFEVTLNRASDRAVTMLYRTADETANAGADFVAASGTLTFAPGSTRETIDVQTLDDDIDEADETFTVTLRGPTGATLADDTATGTITDNDDTPTLSIADGTAVEGGTAVFAVTLNRASDRAVTMLYRTADETADAGADYDAASGTLTFAPGSTRETIDVRTLDDDIDEPDEETFTVTLSAPSGATLQDGTATGTIADNDDEPVLRIADAAPVNEGETARFRVTLGLASERTVTVLYRTAGETALAGHDFVAAPGTLTFSPGTTVRTIEVQTLEDDTDEPDETFTVTLSNPSNATVADGTATGTITDDDLRPLEPITQELLPELGRALAFNAVRCRIEQAFSDMARGWSKPSVNAAPSLAQRPEYSEPGSLDWVEADGNAQTMERVLGNTSFVLPLVTGEGGTARFRDVGLRRLPRSVRQQRGRRGRVGRRGVQHAGGGRCDHRS